MIAGDMEIRLRADIARLQRDMDAGRRVVNDATASMSRAADAAKAALAGIAAGIGLSQIVQMTDQYTKFTAQLRLAATSTREYAASYADVKRISTAAQQDLQATGTLYARIANGTRELGTTQKQVAAITETVNMALAVSGATASESASAQLQLSQAFASGTLRGEEFNAVNEAAPRLMLALADGIGVPVGALKKMAEAGEITSKILADVLPNALEKLREEAKEVHTIAGAFTVLKNNLMEMVGVQAHTSGAVSTLTGAIGLLSSNLGLLAGALATVMAAKLGTFLASATAQAYANVVANRALLASNLASAQAQVSAAAAASTLAAARLAEVRAATLASTGAVQLALTLNGLIPAQTRAAAAAATHTAALAAQSTAMRAASVSGGIARGAIGLLGGPIGAVITLLGLAATAWMVWGRKAKESSELAKESAVESSAVIIAQLDKQIARNERVIAIRKQGIALDGVEKNIKNSDALSALGNEMAAISKGIGANGERLSSTEQFFARQRVMQTILDLQQKINKEETTGAAAAALTQGEARLKFMKEYANKQEQMNEKLAEARKLLGDAFTAEDEARIRKHYAEKSNGMKQEATAYQNLVTSIGERIAANKIELSGQDMLTDAQKMTIKLDAAIASGKNKLNAGHVAEARALIAVVAGQEALIKARSEEAEWAQISSAANADNLESLSKATDQLRAEAAAQQEQNARMGLGAVALAEMDARRLEHIASLKEEKAELAEAIDWTGAMSQAYRDQAVALRDRAAAMRVGASKGENVDVARAKELLDILVQVDEATKSAAAGMADSFGRVGSAIGGLTTALSGYARTQQAIVAQMEAVRADPKNSPDAIAKAEIAAASASAQARIKSYGDMAGAAKGFFKENTVGYKVMESTEKAFRAYEMAMAIKTMLTKSGLLNAFTGLFVASKATEKTVEAGATAVSVGAASAQASAWGITAVVKAIASLPFPANLAAGAATLAAVVALGAKMVGSIGGGSGGGQSAADAQKAQGTGGVFGDNSAKSDSIAKSLELLEKNSGSLIPINRGMLSSLRAIEASMTGLTNLLVRTPGVTDGSNMGIKEGMIAGASGFFQSIGGGKIGQAIANLWGKTKQSIVDSGIQFGGSVNSLQAGQGYNQYASVDTTKSSFFGLSKKTTNSVQTQGLSPELASQFGMIFTNVEKALVSAAGALGVGADRVTSTLDALTIDVTSISLKGLTGTALTEALNAVISKTMDQMAEAVLPEMDQFRQVGEGYAQTVIRIASNYAQLDVTLNSIGMTFGAVGLNSLAARERLIDLAGGIDKLGEQASSFAQNFLSEAERLAPIQKHVADELAAMGLAGITTRDQFKDVVLGLDLATEKGAGTYASLMRLQDAFAAITPAATSAAEAVQNQAAAGAAFMDSMNRVKSSAGSGATGGYDADLELRRFYALVAQNQAEAAAKVKSAWRDLTDSMFDEVKRIRGLMVGSGPGGLAAAQSSFAITTAQARAGDQAAAALLPKLSQSMLQLAEVNSATVVDLQLLRASTAASLLDTGRIGASRVGLSLPGFAVGTNYLPGDMAIIAHEGERIIPAADNRQLMARLNGSDSSAELVAEMRAVRAEVARFREDSSREMVKLIKEAMKSGDALEAAANGLVPLATKETA